MPVQDLSIGGYIPGDSLFHQLDPRAKIICSLLIMLSVFLFSSAAGVLIVSVFVILSALLTRVGLLIWLSGLRKFSWMLAITFALNLLFFDPQNTILTGQRENPAFLQGVLPAAVFTLKILLAITLSMCLTFTTDASELAIGIVWLLKPLKIISAPVETYGTVLLLAMRFVPVLQQEIRVTIDAQKSRGVEFGSGNISERCLQLKAVLAPAILGAIRRADLLATAMEARGFSIGAPRSSYRELNFSSADYFCTILSAFIFMVTILC
jgi:energy-coupling factor transport system permease protein